MLKFIIRVIEENEEEPQAVEPAAFEPEFLLGKNGRILATSEANIEAALNALRVTYHPYVTAAIFEGRKIPLRHAKNNPALAHLRFSIQRHFGFLPPSNLLAGCMRAYREWIRTS